MAGEFCVITCAMLTTALPPARPRLQEVGSRARNGQRRSVQKSYGALRCAAIVGLAFAFLPNTRLPNLHRKVTVRDDGVRLTGFILWGMA